MGRALLLLLLATGCCKPVIQYVPTPCPEPITVARPRLPIRDWEPGKWTKDQLEKILWQSIDIEVGYSKALESVIDQYRSKPQKK